MGSWMFTTVLMILVCMFGAIYMIMESRDESPGRTELPAVTEPMIPPALTTEPIS
jgi:hypothetical protein